MALYNTHFTISNILNYSLFYGLGTWIGLGWVILLFFMMSSEVIQWWFSWQTDCSGGSKMADLCLGLAG